MTNIVAWEYYSSLHNKVTQTEFPAAEALAEQIMRGEIGQPRWDKITSETYGFETLKDCICNVIDKIVDDTKSGAGKGVTSVSNDGYSETFATTKPDELRQEMHSLICIWLSGTGLIGAY